MASQAEPYSAARTKSSFLLGLMGDALALGGHYEYDAKKIKTSGGFQNYAPPGEANNGVGWGQANYHPGKTAGDLTDAGEVAIMLLAHLVDVKKQGVSFSFDSFAAYWKKEIDEGYGSCNFMSVGREAKGCPPGLKPGYINGGSRRTLDALSRQPMAKGEQRKMLAADVNCLVAATHFLPLLFVVHDEEAFVTQARDTVYISHRNSDPVAAAEFLARTLFRLTHTHKPFDSALSEAAAATNYPLISTWLDSARAKVREANDPTSDLSREELVDDVAITSMSRLWDVGKVEPIKIGKASPTEGALPAALYFAIKYQDDPEAALIANANCGGDSAARGIVIGMLLGAARDSALPRDHRWVRGLKVLPKVEALIDELVHADKPAGEEL